MSVSYHSTSHPALTVTVSEPEEDKIDNSFPFRAEHFYFIKIFTKLVSGSNLRIVLWYEKNFNC